MYIKGGNDNLFDDIQQCFDVLRQADRYSEHSLVSGKCSQTELN